MTAINMTFANPAGLALLGLAIPVIVLHILRPRRQSITVSSTFLWRSIERPVSAAAPWQKLRWSALLAAQLLVVALLAMAVAQPVRLEASTLSEHTVFIVDTSGSMAAVDGSPDRVSEAEKRAIALRNELPSNGIASIVVASDRPRVILTASDDPQAFESSLRTLETTSVSADFAGAFSLAESLDTSSLDIGYVLISDGGIGQDAERLLPPGTRYERIGRDATNRAISSISVEPRGTGLHARLTIRNFGDTKVTQPVRVDVDGKTAATQTVLIEPRGSHDVEFDLPSGDRVEAYLDGGDLLAADDVAVAVASRRADLRVLIAGDPLFWQQLFTSIPGVTVDLAAVPAGGTAPDGDGYDIVVANGVAISATPKAPFLAIASPGGVPGAAASGVIDQPILTLLRTDDALLTGIDLTQVSIAQSQRVVATQAEVLAAAEGAPLLLRGEFANHPYLYLAFAVADSNLPVQVAFPILGDRILTELSGTALTTEPVLVGALLPVDGSVANELVGPDGQTRQFEPGGPAPIASLAGFWTVRTASQPDRLIAVNPPPSESAIEPIEALVAPAADGERTGTAARIQHSLLPWVIVPLLALLLLELYLAWRRLGISRRQWRFAVGLRLAVAVLLIAALATPSIRRSSDRIATVFLLDGSASLGPAGSRAAVDWLEAALKARPDDALSAVVVFGGDARLDRVLEQSSIFDGPAVVVDERATDIASALRLGGAVLPSDAKKRVVIISDGRVTTGDALSEAERLTLQGTQVDIHTVEASAGADAAISGIDVPRLARVGDAMQITVNVVSTRAGSATVALRRDGLTVGTKTVNVLVGNNPIVFDDNAGTSPGAVIRYQAIVTTPGDSQPENDAAFAAVPVDGPARVLIVEGASGEGAALNNALQSGGIATKVMGATEIPDVQTLATYSSVILVNVDAATVTGEQVEALTVAVRDLGRGLITIGGPRSYGVGGYRNSPLGELLPVDSEILDPKRRKTVAEVLSIDTSGSMAACHCAAGSSGNNASEGGINKTDIARAAAQRTIEALTATDQIGVLAWNSGTDWVIDLQPLPSQAVIDEGLGRLRPNGNTNLAISLDDAADALINSNAELKHIILFTDGFTDPTIIEQTAAKAGDLYDELGITVSVLGTGEGAAASLEQIAIAGNGRYYPGTNLSEVPQIMAEESVIASRNFINEGTFLPEVTSNDPVVQPLTSAPNLLGYVATTSKPGASTLLRIGPDRDPLLATWQAGLGRVSSWTSDASKAWSKPWATWDGYVDFWTRLAKSTFQAGDTAGAAQAQVRDGQLTITVEGSDNFPDGSVGTAIVAGPDGQRFEVPLDRVGGDRFEASIPANRSGTYAVGVNVTSDGNVVLASSTLANDSYPAEFAPGQADGALMARISAAGTGRGEIQAAQAFDAADLRPGMRRVPLALPLLLAAALLWPIAVALSRLSIRGASLAGARAGMSQRARRIRLSLPRLGAPDPSNQPSPSVRAVDTTKQSGNTSASSRSTQVGAASDTPQQQRPVTTASSATMNELLARKRQRQSPSDAADDAKE